MKKKNWFQKMYWRLQFMKVKYKHSEHFSEGRCTNCSGGNPFVQCTDYYCPCKDDETLVKRKWLKFNWKTSRT